MIEHLLRERVSVEAMSKRHALNIAKALAGDNRKIFSITTNKKNRVAKTCKTDMYDVSASDKWATRFNIFSYAQRVPIGKDEYIYTEMSLVESDIETKTAALARAKELSALHQLPMTIKIVKTLVAKNNTVADVTLKNGQGTYKIDYEHWEIPENEFEEGR